MTAITVEWHGAGRKAQCPPNPAYPAGVDFDASNGAATACMKLLPYPAPECGLHVVHCSICGLSIGVTAAGRADDPRSVKVACKIEGRA